MVVTCSMCWAGACGPLDRVCLTDTLSTYPAFVSNLNSGFALTASPFLKDQKGTKKSSPHRTAFASLRFPRSGSAPWARRHGPSMAHRGSPGIHAGRPTAQNFLSASREGRQIKNTAPRGGRPAGLFGSRVLRNLCRYSVAGQALFVGASLLANDLREQARSHCLALFNKPMTRSWCRCGHGPDSHTDTPGRRSASRTAPHAGPRRCCTPCPAGSGYRR